MTECEVIVFIQNAFETTFRVAKQMGIYDAEKYNQARKWLEQKLSEAAEEEVREMKRERETWDLCDRFIKASKEE